MAGRGGQTGAPADAASPAGHTARAGGRRRRDSRGVSSVLGFVILVGLVVTVVGLTVVIGTGAISDVERSAQGQRAELAMAEFDAQAARTALGRGSVKEVQLGSTDGQVTVNDSTGRILIETVDGGGATTIVDETLGAVVYETGDHTVAYQGGGVWALGSGEARMVSPPEYHYRGRTLTFPLIRVTGGSLGGSPGDGITVRKAGTTQKFPTDSTHNPLEDGHVHVEVTSDYHAGWATYFETRTEGAVRHHPDNRTVFVNLTVPFEVDFDNAVAATEDGPGTITTTGNADFGSPTRTGTTHPVADARIEDRIAACESGGCPDLTTALADGVVENGTYFEDGDVTLGPGPHTYDTSDGPIDVVVDGDLTFTGSDGPGTTDHVISGGGQVTFYVEGSLTIQGNGAVNTGGDPNDLLVFVHSSADEVVAAKGTPQFTGFIYAPGTDLAIKGGGKCGASSGKGSCDGNIVGGVVVETAEAVGNGKLHHPAPSIQFDVAADDSITYLHVTENRITVSDT